MNAFRAFLESLKKKQKSFSYLLALLVVNGVLFAAATYRLANKQELLADEQARLRLELEEKKTELEGLSLEEARVTANDNAVTDFWTDVVKTRVPGLTEAWEEIDRLTKESNVIKGRTAFNRDLIDAGLEQITATMPVEGTYFDLVRFINRLERSERFFLVEKVRLAPQENQGTTTIRLDCSISFYLKAGTTPAEEAGP